MCGLRGLHDMVSLWLIIFLDIKWSFPWRCSVWDNHSDFLDNSNLDNSYHPDRIDDLQVCEYHDQLGSHFPQRGSCCKPWRPCSRAILSHCSGDFLTIDYGDHHDRGDDAAKYIHNHDDDFSGSLPPLRVELALDSDQCPLPGPHHLPPQQAVQVQRWRFWQC